MTVARPETPPAAILFGMRKASRPHAAMTMPSVIQNASRTGRLLRMRWGEPASFRIPAHVQPRPFAPRGQEGQYALGVAAHDTRFGDAELLSHRRGSFEATDVRVIVRV
jgi:hypothetical protein